MGVFLKIVSDFWQGPGPDNFEYVTIKTVEIELETAEDNFLNNEIVKNPR